MKFDFWRAFEVALVAATVVYASKSAEIAADAIKETRLLTINQARLQARQASLVTFATGAQGVDATLDEIHSSLPVDLTSPDAVMKIDAKMARRVQVVARPIIQSNRAFWAAYRSSLSPWPSQIRASMENAGLSANAAAKCFERAAESSRTPVEFVAWREGVGAACQKWEAQHMRFHAALRPAVIAMSMEIYNASAALGFNPATLSPDVTHLDPLPPTANPDVEAQ